MSFNFVTIIPEHSGTRDICVQGHKVKYSNLNNSAADCLISLKFGIEFHTSQVRGQGHRVNGQESGSQCKVRYHQ